MEFEVSELCTAIRYIATGTFPFNQDLVTNLSESVTRLYAKVRGKEVRLELIVALESAVAILNDHKVGLVSGELLDRQLRHEHAVRLIDVDATGKECDLVGG